MAFQHQKLAIGRWQKLTFPEQMANLGSEVERAIRWRQKGDQKYSQAAFFRSLELADLTIRDSKNHGPRLKELCRLRECLVDYFYGDNQYGSADQSWQKYFRAFNWLARSRQASRFSGKIDS